MSLSSLDLLHLALAVAALCVAGFLCWCLAELARLLHQANDVVTDTREKIGRIERAFFTMKEKLESTVNHLGAFVSGWKSFLNLFQAREERHEKRRKTKKIESISEEEA